MNFIGLFQIDISTLESKLRILENDLLLNQKTLEKIHETVEELKTEQVSTPNKIFHKFLLNNVLL